MKNNNWSTLPTEKIIQETKEAISSRGIEVVLVDNKEQALKKIKELIPKGAEVMTGSSTTLQEIGFSEYLKSGEHGWINVHEKILTEKDMAKQMDLRRKAASTDYFLGSVNAIAKTGELVACDGSGSRVTAYPFAAKKLILVAGTQKITPHLEAAMRRVKEYAFSLENERVKKAYGMPGTTLGKWVIIEREVMPNRTVLILVKQKLGF